MLKGCFPRMTPFWCFLMVVGLACLGTGSVCLAEKTVIQKQHLRLFDGSETTTFFENVKRVTQEGDFSFILPSAIGSVSQAVPIEKKEALEALKDIASQAHSTILQRDSLFVFSPKNQNPLDEVFGETEIPASGTLTLEETSYDLRDLIATISMQLNLNLVVDLSVRGNVHISVKAQPWHRVIKGALGIYGFDCRLVRNIWYIGTPRQIAFMTEGTKNGDLSKHPVTISLQDCSLHDLVSLLSHHAQSDFIISRQVVGQVSANLRGVDGDQAVASLVRSRGFGFSENNGIWFICSPFPKMIWNDLASDSVGVSKIPVIEFFQTPVEKVLDLLARESHLEFFISEGVRGSISLRLTHRSTEEILVAITAVNQWKMKRKGERVYLMDDEISDEADCTSLSERLKVFPPAQALVMSDSDKDTHEPLAFVESEMERAGIVYPRLYISGIVVGGDRQCALIQMQGARFLAEPGKEYFNILKVLEITPRGMKAFRIKTREEIYYRF